MDMLLKGSFIHDGEVPKACSVGCDLIDISDKPWNEIDADGCHAKVAAHDGTAEWIERLRDNVFEGLPADKSSWWHVALAEALPEDDKRIARFGSDDWKPYFHAVLIAILEFALEQKECWQERYRPLVESAINQVIEYHMNPSEENNIQPRGHMPCQKIRDEYVIIQTQRTIKCRLDSLAKIADNPSNPTSPPDSIQVRWRWTWPVSSLA